MDRPHPAGGVDHPYHRGLDRVRVVAMIDKATIADPRTHYGHGGTRHFVWQRVTGALNVLFLLFFVWFVVRLAGADRAEMLAAVRNPLIGSVLCLLIVNVCVHMRIGMNEVIEDYIYEKSQLTLLRGLNMAFAIAVAVVTILAVAKIMFWS
jgi:succinate dehydrogenase / fumarate reductase membrane anchor subunit